MKKIFNITLILFILGCSGSDDGPALPTDATLVFPDNNEECTTGIDVAGTNQSTVTFRWNASSNTNSYDLVLRNLRTQTTSTHNSATNQLAISIEKGTPFSWFIVSKSDAVTNTATSETWKFYNAGDPVSSYAPFPADLVSPTMGANLAGVTSQTLSWSGSDIDNDILNYDVYFDTFSPPTTLLTNTASASTNVTVSSGNTYYWRVITHDRQGNNSQSEIFQFKVN